MPRGLLTKLEEEPEAVGSCPLDVTAPDDIKIPCAFALDNRLRLIREHESKDNASCDESVPEIRLESTPEIRLEAIDEDVDSLSSHVDDDSHGGTGSHLDTESGGTPEISLSAPDSPISSQLGLSTTLLAPRPYSAIGAHPKHASALLRLLYVHSSLNPAHRSPQIASLLVPLYSALVDAVDPEDAAHVEADAFWLFEAMIGELSELEEAEGATIWMQKLSQRVDWADTELFEDLVSKSKLSRLISQSHSSSTANQRAGPDVTTLFIVSIASSWTNTPSNGFTCSRWLTTLLTHTLPLPAVLMIWDAVFSRPSRQKGSNPKLEYLVDICTSMLICARGPIFR